MRRLLLALVATATLLQANPALAGPLCPFADLAGDLGQYPSNWIDSVAKMFKSKGFVEEKGQLQLITKWNTPKFSKPSSCTKEEYKAIAQEVIKAVDPSTGLAPATVTRTAFHSCGTWSQSAQNGGCNGAWHHYASDRDFPGNAGINPALDALTAIQKRNPCITLADIFTFAGVVAQEHAGGPATAWHPGRLDALSPGPVVPPFSARLPDGMFSAAGVLYNFLQYGLTMRETVALIGGGHSFGGASADATGWNGSFTASGDTWPTPKNEYFRELVGMGWVAESVPSTGRLQFVKAPGQASINNPKQPTKYTDDSGSKIIRLPSDMALRESPDFSFWATAYALDEALFIRDYTRVLQRTLQFGAGITYKLGDPKGFVWKGLKGTAKDWGTDIQPQLDTVDVPKVPLSKKQYTTLVDVTKGGVVNIPSNKATNGLPAPPLKGLGR